MRAFRRLLVTRSFPHDAYEHQHPSWSYSDHLPFLVFTSSPFPQRILDAIVISMGMAIAFAIVMYLRDRKGGVPFLVAAILMTVQAVAMLVGTHSELFRTVFAAYAGLPAWLTIGAGFALGATAAWLGWTSGSGQRPARPVIAPAA